ncbi:MAG: SDR family oxidoreductase, partial [Alphaproteobacteria bacterium]
SAGGEAHVFPGDAADEDAVQEVVDNAAELFGGLDVLVNNAGMVEPIARIEAAEADEWARCMAVNLIGPAVFCRAALPYLRAARGCVVNISSGAAHHPLEGWAAYCASKAGLWMLTQALHLEEGEAIDVYGASPGTVDTEMQAVIRASGVNPVSQIPQGDLAPASLPAAGVVWLAAERPKDLRGQDVRVRDADFLKRAGIGA